MSSLHRHCFSGILFGQRARSCCIFLCNAVFSHRSILSLLKSEFRFGGRWPSGHTGCKEKWKFQLLFSLCSGLLPPAPESIQAKRWLLLCCSCSWASVDNMRAKTDLLYIILHNDSLVIDSYVSVVNCVRIISNL